MADRTSSLSGVKGVLVRFVVAIVLFALSFTSIGLGIAQRTIWAEPDSLVAELEIGTSAPVTVIDGDTLNSFDSRQRIRIDGDDEVFAAYGHTDDVLAWVGDASHNRVAFDFETNSLVSTLARGAEATVPSAAGSDLWLREFSSEATAEFVLNAPRDISIILMSDGESPAPGTVTVAWTFDNSNPLSGALILLGVGLLTAGLITFIWALVHARRSRGPRRKSPKPPKLPRPPKPARFKAPRAKPVVSAHGRRRLDRTRFASLAASALLITAVVGCSATASTSPAATATPDPGEPVETTRPTVSESQLTRIVATISAVIADADGQLDAELAATRMAGAPLVAREANYVIRDRDSAQPPPPAIPATVRIILPQIVAVEGGGWPRAVFTVLSDSTDATVPPMALVLVQDSPREQYRAHYAIQLAPSLRLPDLAEADVGAQRLPADTRLLAMAPDTIAEAYGDILLVGDESEFAALFEAEGDILRSSLGADYKRETADNLESTAEIEFGNTTTDDRIVTFATFDSGGIVATSLVEFETVRPVESGAEINLGDSSEQFEALVGTDQAENGFTASYGEQLLFYVPPVASDGSIVLLGFSHALISASELEDPDE